MDPTDPLKNLTILASAPATGPGTQVLDGLVAYLSRTHLYARERRVRIDTVGDRRFVVMDPLAGEDECLVYGFVQGAAEAFVAGWDGAMSTVTIAETGW
jgi:hypothetical protein